MNSDRLYLGILVLLCSCILIGCTSATSDSAARPASGPGSTLEVVDLSVPLKTTIGTPSVELLSARNEWTSFAIQVSNVRVDHPLSLRVQDFHSGAVENASSIRIRAYQVLAMPMRPGPRFVRQTGLNTANQFAPVALLEVPLQNRMVNLAQLRDPTQPTNPATHPNGGSVLLWIDVHVSSNSTPGHYASACDLISATGKVLGEPIPIHLVIRDFTLPQQPHLQIVGRLDWDRLGELYPEQFDASITPGLINRADPRYERSIRLLDDFVGLARQNRVGIVMPGLRPIVKWPESGLPRIDWNEYDSVVGPWMNGQTNQLPLNCWAVPLAANLARFDHQSRQDYWQEATAHFGELGWLGRSTIWMDELPPTDSSKLLTEASRILSDNSQAMVAVPLADEGLPAQIDLSPMAASDRVLTLASSKSLRGSTSTAPAAPHRHWLAANPTTGGDETDVRAWGCLAFAHQADIVLCGQTLPPVNSADDPIDPDDLPWFYPGEWFGLTDPVPTIQVKWLRQAEQDYEYLLLAEQSGQVSNAIQIARLLAKPIEFRTQPKASGIQGLMSGTADGQAWERAEALLADNILPREPGQPIDPFKRRSLNLAMLQWAEPLEQPLICPVAVQWTFAGPATRPVGLPRGNWLDLRLAVDVCNAGDVAFEKSQLQWTLPPDNSPWQMSSRPVEVGDVAAGGIRRASIAARFDLDRIASLDSKPIELRIARGYQRTGYPIHLRLPVAICQRREAPVRLDANLSEWADSEAIIDGPLVVMSSRPAFQKQLFQTGEEPVRLYSAWEQDEFYLAFSLAGLGLESHEAHNDVEYQVGRAWGEDLCEALIQPVYADNSIGPVLHVVCKPNGAEWVERKSTSDTSPAWGAVEGSGLRYATTTTTDGLWRGEIAIPWKLINSPNRSVPVLLRFNFSQHQHRTCESASWCGPADSGRDENMMGVLYLRDLK
jgi:hypothetical protein